MARSGAGLATSGPFLGAICGRRGLQGVVMEVLRFVAGSLAEVDEAARFLTKLSLTGARRTCTSERELSLEGARNTCTLCEVVGASRAMSKHSLAVRMDKRAEGALFHWSKQHLYISEGHCFVEWAPSKGPCLLPFRAIESQRELFSHAGLVLCLPLFAGASVALHLSARLLPPAATVIPWHHTRLKKNKGPLSHSGKLDLDA